MRIWDDLDPDGPPHLTWVRSVDADRVVLLLGAFDPPTEAHVAILRSAARYEAAPPAFCMTKVMLARPDDELLEPRRRLDVLTSLAERLDAGFAVSNRGTYREVAEAVRLAGAEPIFVIGSDKLSQLADPAFYPDGEDGVDETFRSRFLVVGRPGFPVNRDDVITLPMDEAAPDIAVVSASDVRARVRSGRPVDHLVPPEVAPVLAGYTAAR